MVDKLNTTECHKALTAVKPNQLRLVLLSLIILVAGIVIGSAGTILIIQKNSGKLAGPIQGDAGRMTHRISERLSLSDEQFGKIKPLIEKHMGKLRSIQEVARPLISSEISEMKENISAFLTDEQKILWEKQMLSFERRFQDKRKMRRDGRNAKPGGGPDGRRGQGSGRQPRRNFAPSPSDRPLDRYRNRPDGQFGTPDTPIRHNIPSTGVQRPIYDQNSRD